MKHFTFTLVLVLCVFRECNSGVISDLPEDQVEQVLALYHQSCGGGGYGSGNSLGYGGSSQGGYGAPSPNEKVSIVCKEPREYNAPEDKKVIRIPPQYNSAKKQVIFVEVPATHFKHEITLVQEPGPDKKTKIYVLPQKADHSIQVDDQRASGPAAKPQVFFLKGNPNTQYPDNTGGYGPPQSQPPSNYGTPVNQPPPNYGPPPNQPPSNYRPPQQSPPTNYGPPSNPPPPQSPPSYGAPQEPPQSSYGSSFQSNYGAPPEQPPQQPPPTNYGVPSNPPPSNYGSPSNPPPSNYESPQTFGSSNYGIPPGYELKQTYEISSNGLTSSSNSYSSGYSSSSSGNSLSSLTALLSSPSNSQSQNVNYLSPSFKSPFSSSLSSSYSSPLSDSSDNTISSLLKKLSERIKSYPRRHATYSSLLQPETRRPSSRFMFPSESQVLPVYKPLQLGSRVVSRPVPRERKFSSKFTYPGKSVIKAREVEVNESLLLKPTSETPVHLSFIPVDDSTAVTSTTPAYGDEELETETERQTTASSHAVFDSAVKNIQEESPIFDVLPATYLGYSYIFEKTTTPIPNV